MAGQRARDGESAREAVDSDEDFQHTAFRPAGEHQSHGGRPPPRRSAHAFAVGNREATHSAGASLLQRERCAGRKGARHRPNHTRKAAAKVRAQTPARLQTRARLHAGVGVHARVRVHAEVGVLTVVRVTSKKRRQDRASPKPSLSLVVPVATGSVLVDSPASRVLYSFAVLLGLIRSGACRPLSHFLY